jgi:hypothetical protein
MLFGKNASRDRMFKEQGIKMLILFVPKVCLKLKRKMQKDLQRMCYCNRLKKIQINRKLMVDLMQNWKKNCSSYKKSYYLVYI